MKHFILNHLKLFLHRHCQHLRITLRLRNIRVSQHPRQVLNLNSFSQHHETST